MGLPAWAMALAAPYAVDKFVVEPFKGGFDAYRGARDAFREDADREQFRADMGAFNADPNYMPDLSRYNNPETYTKVAGQMKGQREEAQKRVGWPVVDKLRADYESMTGGSNLRFLADPDSRAELQRQGLVLPDTTRNPFVKAEMDKLLQEANAQGALTNVGAELQGGRAPLASDLAQVLTSEKGATNLQNLRELAKQVNDRQTLEGIAKWVRAGGNTPDVVASPGLRTVMQSFPAGATLEDLAKFREISGVAPKLEFIESGDPSDPTKKIKVAANPYTGTAQSVPGVASYDPTTTRVNTTTKIYNAAEQKGLEGLVNNMPKLQDEALSAYEGNQRIDKMVGLINKGAAGPKAYAKSVAAPMLGMLGIETQGMNDAQIYQTLSKTLGGSLRQQIVGPGPVTNYEQELLKQVSGGGPLGAAAAKELLNMYRQAGLRKIELYHTNIDAMNSFAPATAAAYRRLGAVAAPSARDFKRAQ